MYVNDIVSDKGTVLKSQLERILPPRQREERLSLPTIRLLDQMVEGPLKAPGEDQEEVHLPRHRPRVVEGQVSPKAMEVLVKPLSVE